MLNLNNLSKIFILRNKAKHVWHSLNVIEENISRAFNSSQLPIEYFDIQDALTPEQIEKLKQHQLTSPVFVYFLSDNINWNRVAQQCKEIANLTYLLPIYGNMTIETKRWEQLNEILIGERVILLGASERSSEQIKILTHRGSTVTTLPYPMEIEPPLDLRPKDNIIRIVYAGRITTGKNILQLMEVFTKAVNFKPHLELHIAGDFHDRGHHFHGYGISLPKLKYTFEKYIAESDSKIFYHGQLSQEELYKLYSQMDVFCSPSAYHDEDFGVSAAQAGLSGLDLILSDWGGHASFPGEKLVRVNVDDLNIPQVDKELLFKNFLKLTKKELRQQNLELKHYLSFKKFNDEMRGFLQTPPSTYLGASSIYKQFCQATKKCQPFFGKTVEARNLYYSIYDSYLGKIPR